MEKIVLFSEVKSKIAYETAVQMAENGYKIYAMTDGEENVEDVQKIHFIRVNRRCEASVQQAIHEISENCVDILVLSVFEHCENDGTISEKHDYEKILKVLDKNINGNLLLLQQSLPMLRNGKTKRIAVLTEKNASINVCRERTNYAYQMSLASMNMMEKIAFNALRPEGFTFRNYAVSEIAGGIKAADYIMANLCYSEMDDYIHSDENRLVMRDALLCEIPW